MFRELLSKFQSVLLPHMLK